jgi:hypothetical protein
VNSLVEFSQETYSHLQVVFRIWSIRVRVFFLIAAENTHLFSIRFDRRFRVYEISDYGETIRTYKRTEKDEIVDDVVLVGHGAPSS